MAGLTSTGLTTKTIDEIIDEINQDLLADIDPSLDVSSESVAGQFVGVFAERVKILWDLLRDVWSAFTPAGASGLSLTQLALLTGTKREAATYSTVTATVNLNAGTTLPEGSRAAVDTDPDAVFETVEEVTNSGGSADDFPVQMRATETGPVRASSGTLTEIVTPVAGWNSITNALDAVLGEEDETDPDLRVRREQEIRIQGSSNIDAIAARVETINGVIQAVGFEDYDTDTFNIVLWDGDPAAADDNDIAQAIWDTKPAGIEATGAESGTAIDRKGEDREIAFDRATQVEIYFEVDLTVDTDSYPVDGDDQVKNAVVDFASENYTIGSDVIPSALYGAIHAISGVVSIDEIRLGTSASPSNTLPITVASNEIALVDTSRIEVNS